MIKQAAESATAAGGPFNGYPPWLLVLAGTVVAAVVLWLFGKLLKWAIWLVILAVLVIGGVTATKMLLEKPAVRPPAASPR